MCVGVCVCVCVVCVCVCVVCVCCVCVCVCCVCVCDCSQGQNQICKTVTYFAMDAYLDYSKISESFHSRNIQDMHVIKSHVYTNITQQTHVISNILDCQFFAQLSSISCFTLFSLPGRV